MTDQKTPLRTMTASQIWHDIEYGNTLSIRPYYEFVLLAEVEKVKETEIQQLKTQIETAKQILKNSPENTLVDCITTIYSLKEVFGEKTET